MGRSALLAVLVVHLENELDQQDHGHDDPQTDLIGGSKGHHILAEVVRSAPIRLVVKNLFILV